MYDILVRAGALLAIILLGYILKRVGVFKQEDFHVLSKLMLNVTLIGSLVSSLNGREIERSMLFLILIGFFYGVFMVCLGYFRNMKRGPEYQVFDMINLSGCNIGCMALPFARSFLGPAGIMAVCLFDVGNVFVCLGGAFSMAAMVKDSSRGFSFKFLLNKLLHSVPLMTYVIMMVLCFLHIRVPGPILSFATIVGDANVFMAMFIVGIGFRLGSGGSSIKYMVELLGIRYLIAISAAVLCWTVLPFSPEARQALVICLLAPAPAAAATYTAALDGDYGLANAINSTSIMISFALLTVSLLIIL